MAAKTYTFDNLMADLHKTAYTPKTEEELQKEAARRYESTYAEKILAAQQAAGTSTSALDRQIQNMDPIYDKQREASKKQYEQTYSQANRQALNRGMQRSSFNNSNLSNVSIAGNKAQQEINDQETLAKSGLEDQKTLLATQLAQAIQQYQNSKTSDIESYLDQLLTREYDRQQAASTAADANAISLYQLGYQQDRDKVADEQWNQLHPKKTSSSSGGGKRQKVPASKPVATPSANTSAGTMILPQSAALANYQRQQQQKQQQQQQQKKPMPISKPSDNRRNQ